MEPNQALSSFQHSLERFWVPVAQRPNLVISKESQAALVHVNHILKDIIHTHVHASTLYLKEPVAGNTRASMLDSLLRGSM